MAADTVTAPSSASAATARLLAEVGVGGHPAGLEEHRRRHPGLPRPGRDPQPAITELIERSGLGGRGGAGFPTARKLAAVAAGRGPRVVVANGTEGEPASGKDNLLLTRTPHLVLDGIVMAAAAARAERAVICVDRHRTDAITSVGRALAERAGELAGFDLRLHATPPRFVAGEESALVHWLNGGPAKPTATPPRPFQRGVDGRPTLVQNVETLAHIAQIGRYGPEWFRRAGPPEEPGTMLVTVSGAVARPAVIEAEVGTPMADLLARAGGLTARPQAMLVGGFYGSWIRADATAMAAPFSRAGLRPFGAGPGAGVLIVLPEGACGLAETARLIGWYSAESAGQCGPCLFGLADLASGTASLARGASSVDDVGRLRRWSDEIEGRGACRHPDGAVRLLRSVVGVFADDFARHVHGQPCTGASAPSLLPVPRPTDGWR